MKLLLLLVLLGPAVILSACQAGADRQELPRADLEAESQDDEDETAGVVLGHSTRVLVKLMKQKASEADGVFHASCMIPWFEDPEGVEAHLLIFRGPRRRIVDPEPDAILVEITRVRGSPIVINVADLNIRDREVDVVEVTSGGLGTEESIRRAAASMLGYEFRLSFSFTQAVEQPPEYVCKLPRRRL